MNQQNANTGNIELHTENIERLYSQVAQFKIIQADRFIRISIAALRKNPKLAECDKGSFMGALLLAAQLGLEPNSPTGHCYLIPYKNFKTRTTECQFQLGYKGLMELVRRSACVLDIYAEVVYKNDEFEIGLGLNRKIDHTPRLDGDRGPAVLVYAVAELLQNESQSKTFAWMTVADINKVRDRSPAVKFAKSQGFSTPWDTDESEMQKKTVIKRLCKMLPLSTEDMRKVQADHVIKRNHLASDMLEEQDDEHERQVEAEVVSETKVEIVQPKAAQQEQPKKEAPAQQKADNAQQAPTMASHLQMQKFWDRAEENGVLEYMEKQHGEELKKGASLSRLGIIMSQALENRDDQQEQTIAQTGAKATTAAPKDFD